MYPAVSTMPNDKLLQIKMENDDSAKLIFEPLQNIHNFLI